MILLLFFWPNCLLFLNVLVENILLLCICHHYLTGPWASPQCCRQALPSLPKVTCNLTPPITIITGASSLDVKAYHVRTIHCRFPMPGDDSAYIVCVADNPRIHYCGDNSLFDPQTLSCLNYEVTSQNLARFWFDPLFTAWASDCPPWSCCPLPVQSLWKIGCSLGQFTFFYNLFKLIYSNSALVFVELPNRTFVRLLLFLFLW